MTDTLVRRANYKGSRLTTTSVGKPLSPRELECLHLRSCGWAEREIAEHFEVSRGTIANHIQRALNKLRARDTAHAVLIACYEGLLGPDADDLERVRDYRRSLRRQG